MEALEVTHHFQYTKSQVAEVEQLEFLLLGLQQMVDLEVEDLLHFLEQQVAQVDLEIPHH
jgi:hypothetical protein